MSEDKGVVKADKGGVGLLFFLMAVFGGERPAWRARWDKDAIAAQGVDSARRDEDVERIVISA